MVAAAVYCIVNDELSAAEKQPAVVNEQNNGSEITTAQ
jgi:hypothetical protein